MSDSIQQQYINYSDFSVFIDLKNLSFFYGNIVGCVEGEALPNLEILQFNSQLDTAASIVSCLDGLPSLKSLYLFNNNFNKSSFHVFETLSSKLPNLEVLHLSGNYLTNDILPSLEGFTSLKKLYLEETGLDSDLHMEALCSKLKNLEVLHLSYNNFNHTDIGSALSGLSSLNSLYLRNTGLTWRSILNISKWSSLEILNLDDNGLNKSESIFWRIKEKDGFKSPINLQKLRLSHNNLPDEFLPSLSGLPFLKSLHLTGNQLKGTLNINENDGFKWPTNLQELWLRGNSLSNEFVSSLSGLSRLQSLDLSYNQLEGAINISGLSTLSNLTNLDLSYNNIHYSVANQDSKRVSRLEVLNLDENMIDGKKLRESLRALSSSIKELQMSYNNFTGTLLAKDFHDLSKLELLKLERNDNMESEFFKSIGNLTSLKVLSLSYCQINDTLPAATDKDEFKWPINLQKLWLNYNNLADEFLPSLSGLPLLKSLHLKANQLKVTLDINENDGFKWPTNLQELWLSHNNLSNNFLSCLSGLPRLQSLDLSFNQLEGAINISGLSTLINLTNLDLSYNNIHYFVANQDSKRVSRLEALNLDGNMIDGKKLRESLRALSSSMKELQMSHNHFIGTLLAEDFHDLSKLELLKLEQNDNMESEFFKSIGNLTSLKVLSLSYCQINDALPAATDWFKLKKLEELNLIQNGFERFLPKSFINMTSLRKLDLSQNHFMGKFDSNIATLTSLEYFDFTKNQFEVPVSFTPFANHSRLKFVYGKGNKVKLDSQHSLQTWIPKFQLVSLSLSSSIETSSFQLPKFLLYQKYLTSLDLSSLKLEGGFPHWLLENNTRLTEVVFRNCSLNGTMQIPLRPLLELRSIDVSSNIIIDEIPSKNISFIYPNLRYLNMSRNHIQGSISREFGQMKLYLLDLSYNQLSGKISEDIFKAWHQLDLLELSNNKLEGPIFTIPTNLEFLSLNDNNFSGRLPWNIFNTSIVSLDVSNNHLVGKIPSLLNNLSTLWELRMSNNHFEGFIPLESTQLKDLKYLDLSQNNLFGLVPSFINSSVKFIHLSNNHLAGLPKKMFTENSPLVMLDLSYNEISGGIQDMVKDLSYSKLNFLFLKGNHITGDIPKQLCQLIKLTMLDLSDNKLLGEIPHCLGTMPFDNNNLDPLLKASKGCFVEEYILQQSQSEHKKEKLSFTSKKRIDTYTGSILTYMCGVDLSNNKLKGNIPYELGNLTKIQALNLSHNDLIGQIPDSFSKLVQTESLDLSFNKLSGEIPSKLNILTSLEVLSVAHNNLSGPIPEWTNQFSTFDESSYEGNPFLCGPPLPKSCHPAPIVIPNDLDSDKDDDWLVDMYVFYVSFVVSYTLALLTTATALYINPSWRQAWFNYMEFVILSCYYFIVDNFYRFCNAKM
ncbi:cuscuta receptor 1-like isoform X2 [Phaseolus vulgaris]|uniref:cuscuta receptor 1-like isoform X2 n=1 Tax=Phaseolus vulgaris TaxID=3885 RepID=UPI0035C9ECB8